MEALLTHSKDREKLLLRILKSALPTKEELEARRVKAEFMDDTEKVFSRDQLTVERAPSNSRGKSRKQEITVQKKPEKGEARQNQSLPRKPSQKKPTVPTSGEEDKCYSETDLACIFNRDNNCALVSAMHMYWIDPGLR